LGSSLIMPSISDVYLSTVKRLSYGLLNGDDTEQTLDAKSIILSSSLSAVVLVVSLLITFPQYFPLWLCLLVDQCLLVYSIQQKHYRIVSMIYYCRHIGFVTLFFTACFSIGFLLAAKKEYFAVSASYYFSYSRNVDLRIEFTETEFNMIRIFFIFSFILSTAWSYADVVAMRAVRRHMKATRDSLPY
ncbi:hypothetical protein PFISCL1PPCAC_5881, partial [Pristionchus fissidentatus]